MAKYWAYTNALLGQPDTSVVADIPAYGAFKEVARKQAAWSRTIRPNQNI